MEIAILHKLGDHNHQGRRIYVLGDKENRVLLWTLKSLDLVQTHCRCNPSGFFHDREIKPVQYVL